MSAEIAWSWSRLSLFEECPRRFSHVNIFKDVPKQDWSYMEEGKRIHKLLEDAAGSVKTGDGAMHPDVENMRPIVEGFCQAFEFVYPELKITLDHEFGEVDWFSKQAWVRSMQDLVGIQDNKAAIIDWKTGKPWPDGGQLALNAITLMTIHPEVDEVATSYVYTKHPGKQEIKIIKRDIDYDPLWDEFEDRAELIQMANTSGLWQPKKNRFCSTCPCSTQQCEFKK